jgi:hypothetical protein
MSDLRTAAQQALDALEWCEPHCKENPNGFERWASVMPVLREALAQPEQEPMAWLRQRDNTLAVNDGGLFGSDWTPLYYADPPQRKPLTDQEAKVLWADVYDPGPHVWVIAERFARAIERAHGIGGEYE